MNGDGRVGKQAGGRGFYARVQVSCQDIGNQASSVTLDPSADDAWYRSEGWTDAALFGAALGLKSVRQPFHCKISYIHGMICDTNPTLIAIAAVRAVWAATGYQPDAELASRIDAAISQSYELGLNGLTAALSRTRSAI